LHYGRSRRFVIANIVISHFHKRLIIRTPGEEVLEEARGQRVMIRSIHEDGVERKTAVKWVNLVPLERVLF
jgi:hypothetical protein